MIPNFLVICNTNAFFRMDGSLKELPFNKTVAGVCVKTKQYKLITTTAFYSYSTILLIIMNPGKEFEQLLLRLLSFHPISQPTCVRVKETY